MTKTLRKTEDNSSQSKNSRMPAVKSFGFQEIPARLVQIAAKGLLLHKNGSHEANQIYCSPYLGIVVPPPKAS